VDHIGKSIDGIFKSGALARGAAGWRAVERWSHVVGDDIAARTRAVRYERGTLYVEVSSSSWVQELTYLKRQITKELNADVGSAAVMDIRFSLEGGGGPRHRSKP